jgi:phage shock protein A
MTSEDIARVKRGPADLEERIEQLEKQKELLKTACKKAGARIRDLEGEISIIKGIGISSPEMREAKAEIEKLKADLARAIEDHQYDNLVHKKELEDLGKR